MNVLLQPLFDRVFIEKIEESEITKGGLVLPPSAKEKPNRGVVVSVGPGKVLDNGETRRMTLKPGDKVLFGKYAGTTVLVNGRELLNLIESDVFAKYEEEIEE